MSGEFDINNFVVDKVLTVYVAYRKCPVCGFDNPESLLECPVCQTSLRLSTKKFSVGDDLIYHGSIKE